MVSLGERGGGGGAGEEEEEQGRRRRSREGGGGGGGATGGQPPAEVRVIAVTRYLGHALMDGLFRCAHWNNLLYVGSSLINSDSALQ